MERMVTNFCANCEALAAERDALAAKVRELTEWRGMESAPRDGTWIVLRYRDDGGNRAPVIVKFVNGAWHRGQTSWGEGWFTGWLPAVTP